MKWNNRWKKSSPKTVRKSSSRWSISRVWVRSQHDSYLFLSQFKSILYNLTVFLYQLNHECTTTQYLHTQIYSYCYVMVSYWNGIGKGKLNINRFPTSCLANYSGTYLLCPSYFQSRMLKAARCGMVDQGWPLISASAPNFSLEPSWCTQGYSCFWLVSHWNAVCCLVDKLRRNDQFLECIRQVILQLLGQFHRPITEQRYGPCILLLLATLEALHNSSFFWHTLHALWLWDWVCQAHHRRLSHHLTAIWQLQVDISP